MRQVVGKVGHGRFVEAGADILNAYVPASFVVLILTAQITSMSIPKHVVLDRHFTALAFTINNTASIKTTRISKMTPQDRREKEDPNHRKGREGR